MLCFKLEGHGKSEGFEELESFTLSDYVADVNSVFIKKHLDLTIYYTHCLILAQQVIRVFVSTKITHHGHIWMNKTFWA